MEEITEIEWTEKALDNYISVLSYLRLNWEKKVTDDFEIQFTNTINYLLSFPRIGILVNKKKNERGILITKHNKLIYRIRQNKIVIISIFDTRQNSKKNKSD